MFVIQFRPADGSKATPELMEQHKDWYRRGFDDGVFFYVGGRRDGGGAMTLAAGVTERELRARVAENAFVGAGVVTPEVIVLDTTKSDPRLAFMVEFQGDRLGYQAASADDNGVTTMPE
jgi:hypothetical protein